MDTFAKSHAFAEDEDDCYRSANELRGIYQASGDARRAAILEVLTERFDYDADYYGVTGDPAEYAKWYVTQPCD